MDTAAEARDEAVVTPPPAPVQAPTLAKAPALAPVLGPVLAPAAAQARSQAVTAVPAARPAAPVAAPTPTAPTTRQGDVASAAQVLGETDMDAIRREGLTGRQLRMARRVAQKHGLAPTSDFDAVRLLRTKGIDPFKRANMLELVVADDGPGGSGTSRPAAEPDEALQKRVQLPQTMPTAKQTLPSTEVSPAERRADEIGRIQRDIAKRRRRKSLLLLTRLMFFVILPTVVAGWYFYAVATPMYATKSAFLILKAESGPSVGGGLLSGTQFATNQDAIAVQGYLQSKDAMLRLESDEGFKTHFSQEWIDPIQRLDADASNEAAYKVYKRNIEIGYDPTEGLIRMEVVAADPEVSAQFSEALIAYAEERVDNLSARKRSNAVADAEIQLENSRNNRRDVQELLLRMQQEGNIADPEARLAGLRAQINTYEVNLQEKNLELQALLDNLRPNQARVDGAQADIRRLDNVLVSLNNEMTQANSSGNSLAEKAIQIQLAQSDLVAANEKLQADLVALEQSRRDASSQARYLTTSVEPVASEDPSYPRSFENTILAFLIFSGIYLMISLTASILREQVSS